MIGKNNELGKDNNLIWHLPNDLKFFKETTTGKTIIIGRRTFESLPRMLPNRHHIVLSSSEDFPEEVTVYKTLEELLEDLKEKDEEMFIIGGASIYNAFYNIANKMYLTLIDSECTDADVFFPDYNEIEWKKTILKECEENNIKYKHVLFERINNE